MLVAAIAMLWPLIRWLRVPDARTVGWIADQRAAHRVAAGFLASFLLMVVLGAILLKLGIYRFKDPLPWGALIKIGGSAMAVSLIEEFLFRGAILGLLRRTVPAFPALLISSALFSIVHFLKPDDRIPLEAPVSWSSGFALIPSVFWQFTEPALVLAGFTTIFLVGWVLGYATLRTGSLWMAIGLHAGWIFGTMGFSKLTKRVVRDTLPWFGADLSVGLGSIGAVILTGATVWWWLRYVDAQPA